jgi:hypothetical protein
LENNPDIGVAYGQIIIKSGNHVELVPDAFAPSGNLFETLLMKDFVGILNVLLRREAFETAGYFDEGLTTYEDIDWMLRLAFHYRFRFTPAPVAIYRLSQQGKYHIDVRQGRTEREFPPIIEKALTMLPNTAKNTQHLRQQVRARVELKIAEELEWVREPEWLERSPARHAETKPQENRSVEREILWNPRSGSRMWAHVLKSLKESPAISEDPTARLLMRRHVFRLCLASKDPIVAVRSLCMQIRTATKGGGVADRWKIRKLLADLWSEAAASFAGRRLHKLTGQAGLCAILNNPAKLAQGGLWITKSVILIPARHRITLLLTKIFSLSEP